MFNVIIAIILVIFVSVGAIFLCHIVDKEDF